VIGEEKINRVIGIVIVFFTLKSKLNYMVQKHLYIHVIMHFRIFTLSLLL